MNGPRRPKIRDALFWILAKLALVVLLFALAPFRWTAQPCREPPGRQGD